MTSSCPCQKSPLKAAPSTQTCLPLDTCRIQVPSVRSVNPSQHLNCAPDWSVRTHQSPRRFHALRLSYSLRLTCPVVTAHVLNVCLVAA
ncbi:hypothetical protein ACE6H2_010630 [Prunus campanulata]